MTDDDNALRELAHRLFHADDNGEAPTPDPVVPDPARSNVVTREGNPDNTGSHDPGLDFIRDLFAD